MAEYRKKLIEVALPLEAINAASVHEKSVPRRGHPATMHLWWARRPLAACRAVLFASLIDDPDQDGVPEALLSRIDRLPRPESHRLDWDTLSLAEQRRQRLFGFIEQLVKWDNSNDEQMLSTAHELILASTNGKPPPVLDPFCGGGSIPLEAQRLGLEAHAADLNPVAVLITKALIEIPLKFANQPPANPVDSKRGAGAAWKGAAGLAADVRYYGRWMRDEAEKRIGHLYPKVRLPLAQGGGEATVIAWLWARTVTCPNPACGAQMPLVRSFELSKKLGKRAWVEPVVDRAAKTVRFEVRTDHGAPREGTVERRGTTCIVCGTYVPFDHIRAEGKADRLSQQLMAVVAEGQRGRVYVAPASEHERVAELKTPSDPPETNLPEQALSFRVQLYGMTRHRDLFTSRQLVALTTFSDLVSEACDQVRRDSAQTGPGPRAAAPPRSGSEDANYADVVATYLAFAVSKLADWSSTICSWISPIQGIRATFARQAIPMVWDFAEVNVFSESAGNFVNHVEWVADGVARLNSAVSTLSGVVRNADATNGPVPLTKFMISTDPPYYDNIGYADLSDFFYVWLRRSLRSIYPEIFDTLLTPKAPELIASPFRFGGSRKKAQKFFEQGLSDAFGVMRAAQDPHFPLTVYYGFKQSESQDGNEDQGSTVAQVAASTGWETMLEGLLSAGFSIGGTWPMRTERGGRSISIGTNALASSIVLVCRPRPGDASTANRREFAAALKRELPDAMRKLQAGNIAPVDLAQASIGPGMAVFSRYSAVLDASGQPLTVRQALQIINQTLDEVLSEQEDEFDAGTRWAITWFEQRGFEDGPFGDAQTLATGRNVGVNGLVDAGIARARGGNVRLIRRDELPMDWDPLTERRLTVWETTQHLIRALNAGGEQMAGGLLAKVVATRADLGEVARDLAYRLYLTCERKKWSQEGGAYNGLVVAWPSIQAHAAGVETRPQQATML